MTNFETEWSKLRLRWQGRHGIEEGTMMRRPALTFAGKTLVFLARLHGPGMGAKIGDTDPGSLGLTHWKPLQPFKDKAPMKGWIVAGPEDAGHWDKVVEASLAAARAKQDA